LRLPFDLPAACCLLGQCAVPPPACGHRVTPASHTRPLLPGVYRLLPRRHCFLFRPAACHFWDAWVHLTFLGGTTCCLPRRRCLLPACLGGMHCHTLPAGLPGFTAWLDPRGWVDACLPACLLLWICDPRLPLPVLYLRRTPGTCRCAANMYRCRPPPCATSLRIPACTAPLQLLHLQVAACTSPPHLDAFRLGWAGFSRRHERVPSRIACRVPDAVWNL